MHHDVWCIHLPCTHVLCLVFCVCGFFFYTYSHRANQQRKKAFDLCSASYVVVVLVILVVGFYFRSLELFFFIFCSITFIFILPLFTHSSCSFKHTCAKCMVLCLLLLLLLFLVCFFFQFRRCAMEFPKNINFILYSGLILIEKTNGSAKLFFFLQLLFHSTHTQRTGVKQFNAM